LKAATMKWALLSVVVAVSAASAQTTLLTPISIHLPSDATTTSYTFSAGGCGTTLTLQWSYATTAGYPCSAMTVWATTGTCGDAPVTGDLSYDQIPQISLTSLRQGTFNVSVAALPGFATAATSCGASGVQVTHTICGAVTTASDVTCIYTKTVQHAQSFSMVYDTKPPAVPTITGLDPLDGSLRAHFSVDSDTSIVQAWLKGPSDADFSQHNSVPAADGTITLTGLSNANTYDVALVGVDKAGNASALSDSWSGTPVHTVGFWGAYRDAGGSDPGGCATAPGFPLLLAALLLKRRRS
jgi:hypothetical protein